MHTDAELVEIIRGGSTEPWGEVFDRWRDSVWHVALSMTRNHSDSEDVVQATFLKAVESIDQLREPDKLRPWLCSIARSTAMDRVRRRRETPSSQLSDSPDQGETIDSNLHQAEVAALVQAAFGGLEPRDRQALELVERDELSGDELASALGVSRDNAYALIHNARTRFARSVESVIVARTGGQKCLDLQETLGNWGGQLTPLLRKRLARHIQQCGTCAGTRDREVTRAALLNVLPLLAMPMVSANGVRAAVLDTAAEGAAVGTVGAGTVATATTAKVAALIVGIIAVAAVGVTAAVITANDGGPETAFADVETVVVPTAQAATTPAAQEAGVPTELPATEPTVPASPAETIEVAAEPTFCDLTRTLVETSATGPASGSPADLQDYMTRNNDLLGRLASSSEADAALIEYSTAYQHLVDAEAWNGDPTPTDPELNTLRASVEAELASTCPAT